MRDVGGEKNHKNQIIDRIYAIHKYMTDLILRQTGVITDTVHSKKAKKIEFSYWRIPGCDKYALLWRSVSVFTFGV